MNILDNLGPRNLVWYANLCLHCLFWTHLLRVFGTLEVALRNSTAFNNYSSYLSDYEHTQIQFHSYSRGICWFKSYINSCLRSLAEHSSAIVWWHSTKMCHRVYLLVQDNAWIPENKYWGGRVPGCCTSAILCRLKVEYGSRPTQVPFQHSCNTIQELIGLVE